MYFVSNIVTVVKLRKMAWVGHVTHMGETRIKEKI
jgi:hypothetical protein